MTIKLLVVTATVVTAFVLKRHYADARLEDLLWILAPTAWLAGTISDTAFTLQAGEGYLSREHLFLIEKSCAGVNFVIAAFLMLTLARLRHAASPGSACRLVAGALAAAYTAAILVNAMRISIAIWLAGYRVDGFSAADVHRFEGVTVYFGGLVLLYEVTTWLDSRFRSPLTTP
jgi:exosortase K